MSDTKLIIAIRLLHLVALGARGGLLLLAFGGGERENEPRAISSTTLWWPPDKSAGRYLAPYLNGQVGHAADVMPQHEQAIHGHSPPNPFGPQVTFGELADVPSR